MYVFFFPFALSKDSRSLVAFVLKPSPVSFLVRVERRDKDTLLHVIRAEILPGTRNKRRGELTTALTTRAFNI